MADLKIRDRKRLRDYFCEIYIVDVLIAIAAFTVALSGFTKWENKGLLGIVAASTILVLAVYKAYLLHAAKNDLEWLYVFLEGVRGVVECVGSADKTFRICVHVKHDKEHWRQLTEYVGGGGSRSKKKAKRRFPRRRGILGKSAVSPNSAIFGAVKEGTSRSEYLSKVFGYEPQEVSSISKDTNCWGAICLGEPDDYQIVLYCDSEDSCYFSGSPNASRKKILTAAGVALARRLESR